MSAGSSSSESLTGYIYKSECWPAACPGSPGRGLASRYLRVAESRMQSLLPQLLSFLSKISCQCVPPWRTVFLFLFLRFSLARLGVCRQTSVPHSGKMFLVLYPLLSLLLGLCESIVHQLHPVSFQISRSSSVLLSVLLLLFTRIVISFRLFVREKRG